MPKLEENGPSHRWRTNHGAPVAIKPYAGKKRRFGTLPIVTQWPENCVVATSQSQRGRISSLTGPILRNFKSRLNLPCVAQN
jgi:hypothetical protein